MQINELDKETFEEYIEKHKDLDGFGIAKTDERYPMRLFDTNIYVNTFYFYDNPKRLIGFIGNRDNKIVYITTKE